MTKQFIRIAKVALLSFLGVVAVAFLAFVAVLAAAKHVERKAQACFDDVLKLQLGPSTSADAVDLARRYGGLPFLLGSTCSSHECGYGIVFQNKWLERLRLAPEVTLGLYIEVTDNRVTMRQIIYSMAIPNDTEVKTIVDEYVPEKAPVSLLAHMAGTSDFKAYEHIDWRVLPVLRGIFMTTEAPPENRKAAYDIDLRCLEDSAVVTEGGFCLQFLFLTSIRPDKRGRYQFRLGVWRSFG